MRFFSSLAISLSTEQLPLPLQRIAGLLLRSFQAFGTAVASRAGRYPRNAPK